MKMFNPVMVGQTKAQDTVGGPEEVTDPHAHSNLSLLDRLSLDGNGVLMFDGKPVDTVGQQFVNAAILSQFSVVDEKLYFDGNPVDTTGSVFANDAVLRMFSQSEEGTLLFNGQPIESSGSGLPNADDLARLAVDESGQLTVDGVVVSGGGGAVTLSVTKLGSGTSLVKGFVGSDLQTRSLVAGTNMTFDVTGDEIKLNATLSGAVAASTTFNSGDGYTVAGGAASNASDTRLKAKEADTNTTGIVLALPLASNLKDNINSASAAASGSVSANQAVPAARNALATLFNGGSVALTSALTKGNVSLNSIISTSLNWTVEFDFVRAAAGIGAGCHLFSSWAGAAATAGLSVGLGASNVLWVNVYIGTTQYAIVDAQTVTDTTANHHVEVVRSGGTVYLFLDGRLCGTVAVNATAVLNSPASYVIGGTCLNAEYFKGYLRDLRISNYAKHTAAYTVAGFFSDSISTLNTVSMAGKLLPASFWKQISSLSVVSTETATAYLKWLMVDATGIWKWDVASSTWLAADPANIATAGMTTTELTAAMLNNQWSYRSDTIGFFAALVTTDGSSTPVLTSVTLRAVQSSDKTAGHTVMNELGNALPQRTQLQFKGMTVTDNGTTTVVQGATLSSDLKHMGASLETVVQQLQSNSGRINTTEVDLTGVGHGSTLAFDAAANKFKASVPAVGAAGNGLFKTAPFVLAAGEEKTVAHQHVSDGRAVYQADQVVAGSSTVDANRFGYDYDATVSNTVIDRILERSLVRLATAHGTSSFQSVANMPVASAASCSYRVDDYIYWMPLIGGNWAVQTSIYRSHISDPTTWTLTSDSTSITWPVGGRVFRYKSTLFMWSMGVFHIASVETPTKWTAVAKHASAPAYNSGGAFLIGSKFYVVGGWNGSGYVDTIYYVDLDAGFGSAWTLAVPKFPVKLGRVTSYSYGDYLYIIGGENVLDTTYSSAIYIGRTSVTQQRGHKLGATLLLALSMGHVWLRTAKSLRREVINKEHRHLLSTWPMPPTLLRGWH